MASEVPKLKLGSQGLVVSAQGLGCMGMTGSHGPPKEESDMIKLLHHAIDSGITFLDTSNALKERGLREKVQIMMIPNDFRKNMPRFQNVDHNKTVYERVNEMAARKGCTSAQLALAWLHHQGNDVIPIPGTTKIENFNQNIGALSVKLTPEEMAELESFASGDIVKGERNFMMKGTQDSV
ncbi:unnamed protein product [Lactuca saligna]|uniref:NADP-dependent oxidoreductase domain-containing protein n=1 Tax=Lactuca saligna TaxID=75948 RepID=A0AA35VE06_LACSI|nr:unnamed protein product [Lactuca saligna]